MKKLILCLALPLSLGSAALLNGCKEKPQEKAASETAKTETKTLADTTGQAAPAAAATDSVKSKTGQKFGYQSQENTMVDAVKQSRIKAITDLEQRMQQSQMAGQQQIAAKREALFKPILDKAEQAIKAVGKEHQYDYIFDTSTGSFIYADESHNVMPLVKAKLGVK